MEYLEYDQEQLVSDAHIDCAPVNLDIMNMDNVHDREIYLGSLGISKTAINNNISLRTMPVDFIEKRMNTLEEMGLNSTVVMNRGTNIAYRSDLQLHDGMNDLIEEGLDAVKVVNAYPNVWNYKPEIRHRKILTIGAMLRYIGSEHSATDVVNSNPVVLGLASKKFRSTVRILADYVNPDYVSSLDARQLSYFPMLPIDSIFTTVANKILSPDFAPEGVTRGHVVSMQRAVPANERRQYSLNVLLDPPIRRKVGMRSVGAYLDYAPIKPAEIKQFPNLAAVEAQFKR